MKRKSNFLEMNLVDNTFINRVHPTSNTNNVWVKHPTVESVSSSQTNSKCHIPTYSHQMYKPMPPMPSIHVQTESPKMVNSATQTKSPKLVNSSSQAKMDDIVDAHDNCMECGTNLHSHLQLQPSQAPPLQALPSPVHLQSLPAPVQLQPLSAPAQHLPLAAPKQLQPLPAPTQLQHLATPIQLQSVPAPAQVQPLPAPVQIQSLPAPTQLQPLAPPTQIAPVQSFPEQVPLLPPFSSKKIVKRERPTPYQRYSSKFICTLCNTNFKSINPLRRHMKEIHEAFSQKEKGEKRPKTFSCDICYENFQSPKTLERHLKNIHEVFSKREPSEDVQVSKKVKRYYDRYL